MMEYVKAFLVGGAICALVQILMEKTKLMPGRIMVLLVCTGTVLGFLGLYEPFVNFAGAGASVDLAMCCGAECKRQLIRMGFLESFVEALLPVLRGLAQRWCLVTLRV